MILLLDIGNTHTHLATADGNKVLRQGEIKTAAWFDGSAPDLIGKFCDGTMTGAAFCSVVPRATLFCQEYLRGLGVRFLELNAKTVSRVGVDYPRPETIGPDRLANAVAAKHHFGAPSVVVDFGTAVTFDVVNRAGDYAGGIIAPGLSAMTDYLHEKTALLPRIKIRAIDTIIGKNTEEAMLIGAVHGYRGLIQGLVRELTKELDSPGLPVIATGGCAELIAENLPEITAIRPELTLEGLRLEWFSRFSS